MHARRAAGLGGSFRVMPHVLAQGERGLPDPERGIVIERTARFGGGLGGDLLREFDDDW